LTLVLYFAPGTCARVPLVALEEASASFDARLIHFASGEHRSPEFLHLNPAGKVPVLLVDGQPLVQNPAILTFLAHRFPDAGLLPEAKDALADAQIQSKLAWCSGDLHPIVTRIRMPMIACDLPMAMQRLREQAAALMAAQLKPIDAMLAKQPWMLGERWSIIDAYVNWIWFRVTDGGFPAEAFPRIDDHSRRVEQRPSVQRAMAREAEANAQLKRSGLAPTQPMLPPLPLSTVSGS